MSLGLRTRHPKLRVLCSKSRCVCETTLQLPSAIRSSPQQHIYTTLASVGLVDIASAQCVTRETLCISHLASASVAGPHSKKGSSTCRCMSDKFMLYTYKIKLCKRQGMPMSGISSAAAGVPKQPGSATCYWSCCVVQALSVIKQKLVQLATLMCGKAIR